MGDQLISPRAEHVMNLVIAIAYFSIPLQILVSLWKYPRLARMPSKIFVLLVLFALFIFLCGAGHLMRFLDWGAKEAFMVNNALTAMVSLLTALYLLPLIPHLLGELDQSLRDLVQLNHDTEESKAKLVTFMAFLCHEIRNPLFAITSSASFLGDTDMTEEQEVGVGSIYDSSLLMLRLVNDVLDLSKIDAGKLELEERDFDMHRLLENLECNMRMQVAQRHKDDVELRFKVQPDVPRVVHGDSTRILQIIYNLLSNSCKFTSSGYIDLTVGVDVSSPVDEIAEESMDFDEVDEEEGFSMALLQEGKGKSKRSDVTDIGDTVGGANRGAISLIEGEMTVLSVTVSDTGSGIDPTRLSTIFEPYSQAKLSDYRKHGGTGLGLSIVSSLIRMMGGTISVSSTVGEGSKFVLRLPVRVSDNQEGDRIAEDRTDMSDPFLDCRRLPVYRTPENSEKSLDVNDLDGLDVNRVVKEGGQDQNVGPIPQPRPPDQMHSDTSGIEVFATPSDQELEETSSSPVMSTLTTTTIATVNALPLTSKSNGSRTMPPASCSGNNRDTSRSTQPPTTTPNVINKETKNKRKKLPTFDFPPNMVVVLVVDDNCTNRKILGKMLKYFNVEYREAVNGQEAVDMVRQSQNVTGDPSAPRYGLVFMDLCMPVMDGYEAIEEIRSRVREMDDVPIVALTANALAQERRRALELGATEFHTKPILRNDLHSVCDRFLVRPPSIPRTDSAGDVPSEETGITVSGGGLSGCVSYQLHGASTKPDDTHDKTENGGGSACSSHQPHGSSTKGNGTHDKKERRREDVLHVAVTHSPCCVAFKSA